MQYKEDDVDLKLAEETTQKIRAYEEKAEDPAYSDIHSDPFMSYLTREEISNLCRTYSKLHRVNEMRKHLRRDEEDECRLII